MNRRPIVAVDLDGVLSDGETFKFKNGRWDDFLIISEPLPGAISFVKDLSLLAHVIIHSSRVDETLHIQGHAKVVISIKEWLEKHEFPPCEVWFGRGKPMAEAYVDDRAVACVPHAMGLLAYRDALQHTKQLIDRANQTYKQLGLGQLKEANHVRLRQATRKNPGGKKGGCGRRTF